MGFFKRKTKKNVPAEAQGEVDPPQPDPFSVENSIVCNVHPSFQWIIEEMQKDSGMKNLSVVEKSNELPTAVWQAKNGGGELPKPAAATRSRSTGRRKKGPPGPCSLQIEIQNSDGEIIDAVHGTSEAFDGLEDKDELVRTTQRCRCEQLELTPPSRLITWDATKEECKNLVGNSLPVLNTNTNAEKVAVLKDPMGSSGTGVFFVSNAEEIHEIIEEYRKRVNDNPGFLNDLIAAKGRIPSWVLQAEVVPCLLIRGRRKFHIRTYVVCVENIYDDEILQTFVYDRHEIRVAGEAVPENETDSSRERTAHITNGALSDRTERDLLNHEPELVKRKLQEKLELFVANIFDKHFVADFVRRVSMSVSEDAPARKFVLGGLDIMVTDDNRLYLLEVNVNPAAPAQTTVNEEFQHHLKSFMSDLMDLVVGKSAPNFLCCSTILAAQESEN